MVTLKWKNSNEETKTAEYNRQQKIINLSNKDITSIKFTQMAEFTELEQIDLSHNNLSQIKFRELSGCTNLKVLDLSYNKMSEVNFVGIQYLKNLEEIDLSYNKIKKIDLSLLTELKNLSKINIESNKIVELKIDDVFQNLSSFNISDNLLKEINLKPLATLTLKNLILSRNKFLSIDLSDLRKCKKLEDLKLDDFKGKILWKCNYLKLEELPIPLKDYSEEISRSYEYFKKYQEKVMEKERIEKILQIGDIETKYSKKEGISATISLKNLSDDTLPIIINIKTDIGIQRDENTIYSIPPNGQIFKKEFKLGHPNSDKHYMILELKTADGLFIGDKELSIKVNSKGKKIKKISVIVIRTTLNLAKFIPLI
ncbi:MAG: leucine-rich repeat domain-containing protein [Candidatus Heimdallarchaeum endolithica]|uniref:Leucine-rich repeat domain-containing protein n=1 Tax=Candidatus Heimdallarchaeum endolithica TaxID=2876572 RepID=A0A9Y1BRN1_9ARCH|nr:MAG: leucine-rich repeat domain-containing protein [Candidatus Heimdallarchaeum endolithica]